MRWGESNILFQVEPLLKQTTLSIKNNSLYPVFEWAPEAGQKTCETTRVTSRHLEELREHICGVCQSSTDDTGWIQLDVQKRSKPVWEVFVELHSSGIMFSANILN